MRSRGGEVRIVSGSEKTGKGFETCALHFSENPHCLTRDFLQVSGEDVDEYRRVVRPAVKAHLERVSDPLAGPAEAIIVYVRLTPTDPLARANSKVGPTPNLPGSPGPQL